MSTLSSVQSTNLLRGALIKVKPTTCRARQPAGQATGGKAHCSSGRASGRQPVAIRLRAIIKRWKPGGVGLACARRGAGADSALPRISICDSSFVGFTRRRSGSPRILLVSGVFSASSADRCQPARLSAQGQRNQPLSPGGLPSWNDVPSGTRIRLWSKPLRNFILSPEH